MGLLVGLRNFVIRPRPDEPLRLVNDSSMPGNTLSIAGSHDIDGRRSFGAERDVTSADFSDSLVPVSIRKPTTNPASCISRVLLSRPSEPLADLTRELSGLFDPDQAGIRRE